jgi:plastocyanin
MLSWGGVSIARNTVYTAVGITSLDNGYVIAFRPEAGVPEVAIPDPDDLPIPGGSGALALTGPQAKFYGYLTPVIAAAKGGDLTYTNLDLERHNVVHDVAQDGFGGPSDQPWCKQFKGAKCPVFYSELIGLAQSEPVLGLENLEPGTTYTFFCTLHPGMKGTLLALQG